MIFDTLVYTSLIEFLVRNTLKIEIYWSDSYGTFSFIEKKKKRDIKWEPNEK